MQMAMNMFSDPYFSLLKQAVFSDELEEALTAAAELGHSMLKMKLMPEDVAEIHQQALVRLADEHPELKLIDVAPNLMGTMMEVLMAYSLDLRRKKDVKKMLKAKLAHAGRMEAIGTMVAGIAHDFNTILGVINGYAELLQDDFPVDSGNHRYTQQIIDADARARPDLAHAGLCAATADRPCLARCGRADQGNAGHDQHHAAAWRIAGLRD